MSVVATRRRRATRMLNRQSVLRFFQARHVDPYGDSVGEDDPSAAGEIKSFRGAVSSLKTGGADEMRSILTPSDIRARFGFPPDESIWVREVARSGAEIPDELWSPLVGSPQPAAENAMRGGIGLTVIHTAKGAARGV